MAHLLAPPQIKLSSPLQFGQEENIPGHSIERRTYWFILKIARMFPFPLSRNKIMSSFITPSPRDKTMHFPIPKSLSFSLQFGKEQNILGHSFEKLNNLFWKLTGYSLFPHRQMSREECKHFANNVTLFVYSFLFYVRKKNRNLACFSSKQIIGTLALNS